MEDICPVCNNEALYALEDHGMIFCIAKGCGYHISVKNWQMRCKLVELMR